MSGKDEDRDFRSAEVAAFFEKLNYLRKPIVVRNAADTEWRYWHWYAGDRIVQDVLDGKKSIGLRASYSTSMIGFDIDTPGKPEENSGIRGEVDAVEAETGEITSEPKERDAEAVKREKEIQDGIAAWAGWDELRNMSTYFDDLSEVMAAIVVPEVAMGPKKGSGTGRGRGLSLELSQAAEIVKGCFTVEPSLAVKSPHGVHLYWCLEEAKPWTQVRPIAQRVKEEAEDQYAEIGIERKIELRPSPTQALRLPRKDRLLEPGSLEPMEEPKDGEAFWKGLKQYRLEEIVKEEVLERVLGEHRRKPYRGPKRRKKKGPDEEMTEEEKEELRARATGNWEGSGTGAQEGAEGPVEHDANDGTSNGGSGGSSAGRDGDAGEGGDDGETEHGWNRRSKKPKNKAEAEQTVMPFRNGETNRQLIAMVEAGKRASMTVAEIVAWVNEWIDRSRAEGDTGDLGMDAGEIERRVARLFERCHVTTGNKGRWIELWDSENGKYTRDSGRAETMLGRLESVQAMATQRRPVVIRFFADIDAWKRIIDDEVKKKPGRLDALTIENQMRGVYPLPQGLLRALYGKYPEIWKACEQAGIVVKDGEKGSGYAPSIGRPQYYSIEL
jgi:head-tail adaptor